MITILASLAGSAAATAGTATPSRADATRTTAVRTLRKRELPSDLGVVVRARAGSAGAACAAIAGWSRADGPSVRGRVGCQADGWAAERSRRGGGGARPRRRSIWVDNHEFGPGGGRGTSLGGGSWLATQH